MRKLAAFEYQNKTPGTRGGPGGRDRMLAVNNNYKKQIFVLHISYSYAKILGETNFHTREIPPSGSKAKDGERREKKRD